MADHFCGDTARRRRADVHKMKLVGLGMMLAAEGQALPAGQP
jgi:hypothetical protein